MIHREHKDRLFCFIFGRAENRAWTLELYNAVNGSSHDDPDAIQITTMEDILYMGMKNDVSFIIAHIISIYEQQSSFNPNMPLRELMYAARLYDKYIRVNRLNIYGSALVPLPTPRACLKIALCQPRVTICGEFVPNEGGVAGYADRMRGKLTAKWGVRMA